MRQVILAGLLVGTSLGCSSPSSGDEDESGGRGFMAANTGGSYTARGVISLPSSSSDRDTFMWVALWGSVGAISSFGSGLVDENGEIFRTNGAQIEYEVSGLAEGPHLIELIVNENLSSSSYGGPGDFVGWYGGTVAAPAMLQGQADYLDVTGDVDGADFGLGTAE